MYLGTFCSFGRPWIANNNFKAPAKLVIDDYGSLKVSHNNDTESVVLYSSEAVERINVSATLLNTGNFVLSQWNKDGTVKQILWQSFDHPTNILLPGMRLGFNRKTGQNWTLTSRTGSNTRAPGSFTLGVDPNNKEQLVMRWKDSIYWTSRPLVDKSFPNVNATSGGNNFYFNYASNENETYFSFDSASLWDEPVFIGLNPYGQLYGRVSVSCNSDDPALVSGCVAQRFPTCRNQDTYVSMTNFKFGNMSQEGYKKNEGFDKLSLYDCGVKCLHNCSCFAYSSTTADNTGCQIWDKGAKFATSSVGQPIYFLPENIINREKSKGEFIARVLNSDVGTLITFKIDSFFFFPFKFGFHIHIITPISDIDMLGKKHMAIVLKLNHENWRERGERVERKCLAVSSCDEFGFCLM